MSSMRPADLLRLSVGALGANRLRSTLTMLGITIGVFSVVGVMTALSAMRSAIDSGLSQLGSNVFEISKFPGLMINDGWWNYRHRPTITYQQSLRFQHLMAEHGGIVTMTMVDRHERIRYGDRRTSARIHVIGANENYLYTHSRAIAYGRFLSQEDMEFNRPVMVIGSEVRESLFPNEDPLGKIVFAEGARYEVVGVFEEKGKLFGQSMDGLAVMPITRFLAKHFNWHRSMELAVQAPNGAAFDATRETAIGLMRLVRALEPEDLNDFEVYSNDSLRDAFGKIAVVVGTAGLLISVIALITAGVGIMNIMLVNVTERTREIGLRKSLGARSRDILRQFLLEAVFLCETGGLLGILLGVLVGNVVAHLLRVPMIFPWFWAIAAVVVCSVIGITFGYLPAWKASRLTPVEALRYE